MGIKSNSEYSKRILSLIGGIAVEWSNIELLLLVFISKMLFKNMDDGVVVFEGINHSTMLKMLRPIYYSKIKTKKYDDALNDLAKAIKILGDKRNAVVHSQWFIDLEPETAMRVKIKKTSYENTKRKKIELGTDVEDEQTLIELINLLLLCNKTIKRLQYILEYEGEIVSK